MFKLELSSNLGVILCSIKIKNTKLLKWYWTWMTYDTTTFFQCHQSFLFVGFCWCFFFFLTNNYSGAINFWGCSALITSWRKNPNPGIKLQFNLGQILCIKALKKGQCLFYLRGTYLCSFSVWWLRLYYLSVMTWHTGSQIHRFED